MKRRFGATQPCQHPFLLFYGGCSFDASFQLHHFSDASEYGYGTVSYLRTASKDGTVECSFTMAKSRTAPHQYVSVPRLELQVATISERVHCLILNKADLKISWSFFWRDSKVTLQYIKNGSCKFKTYVSNRLSEIWDVSQPSQQRHCLGSLNPAVNVSRGLAAHQFLSLERWVSSPTFLLRPKKEWPHVAADRLSEDDPKVKNEKAILMLTEPNKLKDSLAAEV